MHSRSGGCSGSGGTVSEAAEDELADIVETDTSETD